MKSFYSSGFKVILLFSIILLMGALFVFRGDPYKKIDDQHLLTEDSFDISDVANGEVEVIEDGGGLKDDPESEESDLIVSDVGELLSNRDSLIDLNRGELQVGVHSSKKEDLVEFEDRTGAKTDIVAVHIHWGNESAFPKEYAEEINRRGATVFIFWNPMNYNRSAEQQRRFHFDRILDGSWDDYIDEFIEDVKNYGGPVMIAPMEEVNGYWTFWGGPGGLYGTTEEYREVFRYLHERSQTASNVQFVWVVNSLSVPNVPENSFVQYYPGSEFVDVIGINVFNFGDPWVSFDELVRNSVVELRSYQKPILITSTASAEGESKALWIKGLFDSPYFTEGPLQGFVWFNEDKERNWLIWSDSESLDVFRTRVQNIKKSD